MPDDKYKTIRENIAKAEKSLADLAEELRKARLAGLDMTVQEKQYSDLAAQVVKMKSVYGV